MLRNSSYCQPELLPTITRAVVDTKPFSAQLPPDSVYITFLEALEKHVQGLSGLLRWGIIHPADAILDLEDLTLTSVESRDGWGTDPVPFQGRMRGADGRLNNTVAKGLSDLTTGLLFFDVLVWLFGDKEMQRDVLKHRPLGIYVTKEKALDAISDLKTLTSKFVKNHQSLHDLSNPNEDWKDLPVADRLMNEFVTIQNAGKSITAMKNVFYIAYAIHMLMKGFPYVPVDFADQLTAGASGLDEHTQRLSKMGVAGPKLPRALLLAVTVSPLLALGTRDLTNTAIGKEDAVLSRKQIGNHKPRPLLSVEKMAWTNMLDVAEGKISVTEACRRIAASLLDIDWTGEEYKNVRYFYKQVESVQYSNDLYTTAVVLRPVPPTWRIPDAPYVNITCYDNCQSTALVDKAINIPATNTYDLRQDLAANHLSQSFASTSNGVNASTAILQQEFAAAPDYSPQKESAASTQDPNNTTRSHLSVATSEAETPHSTISMFARQNQWLLSDSGEWGGQDEGLFLPDDEGRSTGVGFLADFDNPLHSKPDGSNSGALGDGQEDSPEEYFAMEVDPDESLLVDPDEGHDSSQDAEGDPDPDFEHFQHRSPDRQHLAFSTRVRRGRTSQLRLPCVPPARGPHQATVSVSRKNSSYPSAEFVGSSDFSSSDSDHSVILIEESDIENTDKSKMRSMEEKIVIKVESSDTIPLSIPRLVKVHADNPRYSESREDVFTLYDGAGVAHVYKLVACTKEDYEAWLAILKAVLDDYTDVHGTGIRRPLHIDAPSESAIFVCTEASFKAMSVAQVQAILQKKHILVLGQNFAPYPFADVGLETLADLFKLVEVQDQSLEVNNSDYQSRMVQATLKDMYDVSLSSPEWKKSLNALGFTMPQADVSFSAFASDVRAVFRSQADGDCIPAIPADQVRFGIASTEGALTYFHIDPRGDATFVDIKCGIKLWVIAVPRNALEASSIRVWSHREFDIRRIDRERFRLELLYLRPGDRFFQLGDTPHAVLTAEDSIVHGGHFIPFSSVWRTIIGGIHCFFEGGVITNVEHGGKPDIQARLAAMVCFLHKTVALGQVVSQDHGHIPAVDSPDGLTKILLLACGVELQNATCPYNYMPTDDELLVATLKSRGKDPWDGLRIHDISAVSLEMRCRNVTARGRMKDTLRVLFNRIVVRNENGEVQDPWAFLFIPMLAWLIRALEEYYKASFKDISRSERPPQTFVPDEFLFSRQLRWVVARWEGLAEAVEELDYVYVEGLVVHPPVYTVSLVENPPPLDGELSHRKLRHMGFRTGDTLYFSAYTTFVESVYPADGKDERSPSLDYEEGAVPSKRRRRNPVST